ncbi:hypothetical protein DEU38_12678 [Rhodococcus sp. AG1013]|uniref:hypothetical protein n=1 Tax=Rhodococcus sp. AG1013 TaxID=2183996 RepID=UPI000E0BAFDF|nr:hypothetical protein [Rhodococcus sp. AG1013]RDI16486.1 hypothetical protein DEU38_12678 [Rhodococcus sp. AG1013]
MTGTLDDGLSTGTGVPSTEPQQRWTPRLVTVLVVPILVSEIIPVSAAPDNQVVSSSVAEVSRTLMAGVGFVWAYVLFLPRRFGAIEQALRQ